MLRFYSLVISFVVWSVLLPLQLLKLLFGRSSRDEICQRMGWIRSDGPSHSKTIIMHAVSYGEMISIGPIISSLIDENPRLNIVLTTGTSDGIAAARSLQRHFPAIIIIQFMPWDRAQAVKCWLKNMRPDLLVLVENEIWPNLINTCRDLEIPVAIVNGRIYPADVARYRLIRGFMHGVFSGVSWIGVQDAREYQRFFAIGAAERILETVGNIKYDQPGQEDCEELSWLSSALGSDDRILVAGSTHSPEEKMLLQAFKSLKLECHDLRLVLVPRKISRGHAIEKLVRQYGLRAMRCSTLKTGEGSWDVLVVDKLGWLGGLYGMADVVYIGGSLVNHGGHNLLEAAAHGKAIVVGPHMQNFQGIVEEFSRKKALFLLNGKNELEESIRRLLADAPGRTKLGKEVLAIVLENKGCSQHYSQSLQDLLATSPATVASGS